MFIYGGISCEIFSNHLSLKKKKKIENMRKKRKQTGKSSEKLKKIELKKIKQAQNVKVIEKKKEWKSKRKR